MPSDASSKPRACVPCMHVRVHLPNHPYMVTYKSSFPTSIGFQVLHIEAGDSAVEIKRADNRSSSSYSLPHSIPLHLKSVGQSTALLTLLLYPRHIRLGHRVPRRHVLFHAGREASLFAFGQGCSGLGYATFEAVFVEFLAMSSIRSCISGGGVAVGKGK